MCVLAVESSLLTPSWQGKMDGLCYRFLADTSPYNRLISYYQQPQTLKLIFIGVKKEIPHGIVNLYGSHLSMVIFFKRCVCLCPMQVEILGDTPKGSLEEFPEQPRQ